MHRIRTRHRHRWLLSGPLTQLQISICIHSKKLRNTTLKSNLKATKTWILIIAAVYVHYIFKTTCNSNKKTRVVYIFSFSDIVISVRSQKSNSEYLNIRTYIHAYNLWQRVEPAHHHVLRRESVSGVAIGRVQIHSEVAHIVRFPGRYLHIQNTILDIHAYYIHTYCRLGYDNKKSSRIKLAL